VSGGSGTNSLHGTHVENDDLEIQHETYSIIQSRRNRRANNAWRAFRMADKAANPSIWPSIPRTPKRFANQDGSASRTLVQYLAHTRYGRILAAGGESSRTSAQIIVRCSSVDVILRSRKASPHALGFLALRGAMTPTRAWTRTRGIAATIASCWARGCRRLHYIYGKKKKHYESLLM